MYGMISIKKLIERTGGDLFQATLASYRSVLNAMGESGMQACPAVGTTLRRNLLALQAALSTESTPVLLQQIGQKVETELTQWGGGAAAYFKQRAGEVKEVMMILARTTELTGERDQRYSCQLEEFTGRLEAMADLHDLVLIRDSLLKSAIDLRACAAAMTEESQKSVARLREDVKGYQARLDDAERLAGQDPLTGLDNRRRVEASIEYRIGQGKPFSVFLLDLNGFKQLNDTCGHLAADELLKQFSTELKSLFRAGDLVGRWGGDELIVVLDGGLQVARAHIERISRWVFGEYTIRVGDTSRKVVVSAAIGVAEWQAGDSLRTLLDRADAAMYRDKRAATHARA
jgi:diguanylate cyclase (GGDEF)-like protein